MALRLRMTIGRELDERGITNPAAIGAALGLPAAEATKLLVRHQWREGDVALYEANAGFARPEMTVQAHLDLAEHAGATLCFGEEVTGWTATADGVRVTTPAGTYRAGQLVICPGAWAPQLLAEFAEELGG